VSAPDGVGPDSRRAIDLVAHKGSLAAGRLAVRATPMRQKSETFEISRDGARSYLIWTVLVDPRVIRL
jgi:hypothetical protein